MPEEDTLKNENEAPKKDFFGYLKKGANGRDIITPVDPKAGYDIMVSGNDKKVIPNGEIINDAETIDHYPDFDPHDINNNGKNVEAYKTYYDREDTDGAIKVAKMSVSQLNNKVREFTNIQKEYFKSPEYKERLIKQGVPNPDDVIKGRIDNLSKIKTVTGPASFVYYAGTPTLQVPLDATDETIFHEISHATNQFRTFPDAKTADDKGMSGIENWYLLNRSKLPASLKSEAFDNYVSGAKKYGQYETPSENLARGRDPHDVTTPEFKSDLDALRFTLKKYGLTKKHGENITEDTLNKAEKIKEIKNEPHFKRIFDNFGKKEIVDLNNNLAVNEAVDVNNEQSV